MPLGAAFGTEKVFSPMFDNPLLHSSTLGGNPLACAAGIAALKVLREEGLAERAAELGEKFLLVLKQIASNYPEIVRDVRGKGLLIGVEFHQRKGCFSGCSWHGSAKSFGRIHSKQSQSHSL